MLKAFLSHSSTDKEYVEKIAEKLTTKYCVYDKFSFEEASETAEEIVKHIDNTGIFVFFISENSLKSKWVQMELEKVHALMEKGVDKKILPIIIDDSITHKHALIPQWLKDNYNIQPIRRYMKAVHRIRQELLRLSWKINSSKAKKDTLFVGRNTVIDILEGVYRENFYPPMSLIASGINGIGRKSLIKEYMQKVGIAEKSKYMSVITLEINESIEDLILKLDDLGLSSIEVDFRNIATLSLDEKIIILCSILDEIQNEDEVVYIEDNGCIVLPDRSLTDWYVQLLDKANNDKKLKKMIFAIISKYRLNKHLLIDRKNIYAIDIIELESKEIDWLFKGLLRLNELELDNLEYSLIRDLLYGHPEQVLYAINLLKLEGFKYINKDPHVLVDFNLKKISYLLTKYKENTKAKSLLAMLAKFDFIDYELLYELIGNDVSFSDLIHDFLSESICNEMGANKETIKLNKAVRDIVRRGDWKVDDELSIKIKAHVTSFLHTYESEEKSLSDYFYSMQEILINNPDKIDISRVIPSHILKTISTLYDVKKKWNSVISIANDALYENFNNLDGQIENQIRQYLCLAYIRIKNSEKFLEEVNKMSGTSHDFLLGYYYRTMAKYDKATERLQNALRTNPSLARAKRELVQVYLSTHDYESALELAKDNYENNKQNAYAFQAYSTCLIKTYHKEASREKEIKVLLSDFEPYKEDSEHSNEVYDIEYAKYMANVNPSRALDLIDDAIDIYRNSIYPTIAKFDIAERLDNTEEMKKTLESLKKLKEKLPNKTIISINEAILLSKQGRYDMAKLIIDQLRNYPEKSKKKLFDRLGIK